MIDIRTHCAFQTDVSTGFFKYLKSKEKLLHMPDLKEVKSQENQMRIFQFALL